MQTSRWSRWQLVSQRDCYLHILPISSPTKQFSNLRKGNEVNKTKANTAVSGFCSSNIKLDLAIFTLSSNSRLTEMWIQSPTGTVNYNLKALLIWVKTIHGVEWGYPQSSWTQGESRDITYQLPWQEEESAWGNKLNILPTNIYLITDSGTGKQKDKD